ncbi:hypothetical protein GTY86_35620 [Streptomyces sp. SID5770]|uniref:hypothetical protein n=1 Tax=Streptomyces sp. SID5770 TaxID=2690308 RepID=UPI0013710F21|nr:hypothetical protein [Streptomyces sp. SID5770]MZE53805.1 hypothetical protein [Streptomyces sp. SID5770]MZE56506.1 hypothetical protein [Streptomyces sp. SID5770]
MTEEPYPWVRRESERGKAYAAFREYLNLGPRRTIRNAAEQAGITYDSAQELSIRHEWVARSIAYDQHLATAATDGLASQMASARDDNLALAARLREHLVDQLETCMRDREDPSVRWSQALGAMVRLEEHAFRLKDDPKTSAARSRVEDLLRRVEESSPQ